MDVNYMRVVVATIAQFVLGAVWYSPLMFGKWWMQFMNHTSLTPDELKRLQKQAAPFYLLQLFLTLLTTVSLANLAPYVATFSIYHLAFWIWIGFIAPVQVASVIWGNTERKFWLKQIFVMLTCQLATLMLAAWILSM